MYVRCLPLGLQEETWLRAGEKNYIIIILIIIIIIIIINNIIIKVKLSP
jgi:hypothetical protein